MTFDYLKSSNEIFQIINTSIILAFFVLKFLLAFIFLSISFLTISKLRGNFEDQEYNQLKKPRIILSSIYIFIGLGVLFNFFLYFLLFINEFLPTPLIIDIFNLFVPESYKIDELSDYNRDSYQFVRTLYLIVALVSFEAFLHLILTIYYLVNNNKNISNPKNVIYNLLWSVFAAVFFGLLTFVHFFLTY
ncbi:MAG: hypothetical protein ACFFAO_21395 [Candidatus Hermodarchaeota archaeon]